jgi:hypothetical protein
MNTPVSVFLSNSLGKYSGGIELPPSLLLGITYSPNIGGGGNFSIHTLLTWICNICVHMDIYIRLYYVQYSGLYNGRYTSMEKLAQTRSQEEG